MRRLTEAQMQLLRDLIALEDAGYLSAGGSAIATPTWNGFHKVDTPPVVTPAGREALRKEGGE